MKLKMLSVVFDNQKLRYRLLGPQLDNRVRELLASEFRTQRDAEQWAVQVEDQIFKALAKAPKPSSLDELLDP